MTYEALFDGLAICAADAKKTYTSYKSKETWWTFPYLITGRTANICFANSKLL